MIESLHAAQEGRLSPGAIEFSRDPGYKYHAGRSRQASPDKGILGRHRARTCNEQIRRGRTVMSDKAQYHTCYHGVIQSRGRFLRKITRDPRRVSDTLSPVFLAVFRCRATTRCRMNIDLQLALHRQVRLQAWRDLALRLRTASIVRALCMRRSADRQISPCSPPSPLSPS